MAENFFAKLEKRIEVIDSLLCIGLDPHIGQVCFTLLKKLTQL